MWQIIQFFKKLKNFFFFFFFFVISLAFIFYTNLYPKSRFLHSSRAISGQIYSAKNSFGVYLDLKQNNQILSEENKKLRQELLNLQSFNIKKIDSLGVLSFSPHSFKVLRAEVIKNTIGFTKNYFLINKGEKDSVFQDMGVISSKGVVGIIDKTSGRFAGVQSILNVNSRLSVALKKSSHFGTLNWDGKDIRITKMLDVPNTANLVVGDTVVTDGRSNIFPKNIPVGKVKSFKINPLDNSYTLDIELFTDMSSLQHIYIIQNKDRSEIIELETQIKAENE